MFPAAQLPSDKSHVLRCVLHAPHALPANTNRARNTTGVSIPETELCCIPRPANIFNTLSTAYPRSV